MEMKKYKLQLLNCLFYKTKLENNDHLLYNILINCDKEEFKDKINL